MIVFKLIFVVYFFVNGVVVLAKACEHILSDERFIQLKHLVILNIITTVTILLVVLLIFLIEYFNL